MVMGERETPGLRLYIGGLWFGEKIALSGTGWKDEQFACITEQRTQI